jgi:hypothetical protein
VKELLDLNLLNQEMACRQRTTAKTKFYSYHDGEGMKLQAFAIEVRHKSGNLHLGVSGVFNGVCAWALFKILWRQPTTSGRVFVGTAGIEEINSDAVELFKHHMSRHTLPPDWLYFKGKKGFQIAPDGSRVMVASNGPGTLKSRPRHSIRSRTGTRRNVGIRHHMD